MPPERQFKIVSLSLIVAAVLFPVGLYFAAKGLAESLARAEDKNLEASALEALTASGADPLFAGEAHRSLEVIFGSLDLEARAAYVYDLEANRSLYAKDADIPLPLASLTKVMTALLASELPADTPVAVTIEGFETYEVPIIVPTESLTEANSSTSPSPASSLTPPIASTTGARIVGTIKNTLPVTKTEHWRLWDLIDYTLLVSFNEGAEALARASGGTESAFVGRMNERAMSLGLETFRFQNPSGLDENGTKRGLPAGEAGAYGSARDVARLFEHILDTRPELFLETTLAHDIFTTKDGVRKSVSNTNPLVASIPGIIASKTGFTDRAGGNLAIAYNAGPLRPIIIVVLGSTKEGRFSDMEKLVAASIEAVGK